MGNDGKMSAPDQAEVDRLRRSMRDGVFEPWVELGRARTPDEVGERLHLDARATTTLMDELAACGESVEVGIRRVPESDLIAVAWPFANVPTGITVTVDGRKPVQARCAVDSLGVSKMMGRKATIDAEMRDSKGLLHVVVDGEKLVSAEPANAVVFKGSGCDEMLFFSSEGGLDSWKKQHGIEGGKVFALADAVVHGAEIFGKFTAGL
jgi:alkylmercury lyase-like protein